jgi:hypothetical protein
MGTPLEISHHTLSPCRVRCILRQNRRFFLIDFCSALKKKIRTEEGLKFFSKGGERSAQDPHAEDQLTNSFSKQKWS